MAVSSSRLTNPEGQIEPWEGGLLLWGTRVPYLFRFQCHSQAQPMLNGKNT